MAYTLRLTDEAKASIKKKADEIREQLKDTRIYGCPLDMNDSDMVLVAAYGLSEYEQFKKELNRKQELDALFNAYPW